MAKAVAKIEETSNVVTLQTPEQSWLQTIERLAPAVGIEGVRELMTMRREEQANQSQREYNAAMSSAQSALKPVVRNVKNTQTGKNYADLAAIAAAAMPIIHEHGFAVSHSEFKSELPNHVGIACEVMHRAGHSKRYEFNVPSDGVGIKGNPNKTATWAYGSTLSYGRRYSTCCVFDIATKDDDDGNAAGGNPIEFVTDEQTEAIQKKIAEVGADVAKFLEMGGVESISDIRADQYQRVMDLLEMKKSKRA